mmetsp:Transcript_140067/g.340365  ORF Transcript_140067/g.340365 Transcript_140067/m.340365 type:complete len:204 (+) Transcript_140067:766-1377(+)
MEGVALQKLQQSNRVHLGRLRVLQDGQVLALDDRDQEGDRVPAHALVHHSMGIARVVFGQGLQRFECKTSIAVERLHRAQDDVHRVCAAQRTDDGCLLGKHFNDAHARDGNAVARLLASRLAEHGHNLGDVAELSHVIAESGAYTQNAHDSVCHLRHHVLTTSHECLRSGASRGLHAHATCRNLGPDGLLGGVGGALNNVDVL